MDSILNSVKKIIGLDADYEVFDTDVILAINSAFFILWQLGVGTDRSKPFTISDASAEWSEFIEPGKIELVKNYVALRVRLMFDPPSSSFLLENINKQIEEYETRMLWTADEEHYFGYLH